MKILIDAVSAKMGGAENYIKSVARELAVASASHHYILIAPGMSLPEATHWPNIEVRHCRFSSASRFRRLWFDQVTLRRLIRREHVDVLFSTANFAMFACPCRQVLLVRNSLYFTRDYLGRILPRHRLKTRMEVRLRRLLNCLSIRAADVVMAPTQAMIADVRRFVRLPEAKAVVNHYGVDPERFRGDGRPPGSEREPRVYRLLFSSLYGEHKNLRTLLEALLHLARSGEVGWRLVTPADPNREDAHWTRTWREDAQLAAHPLLRERIEFLPRLGSDQMPIIYKSADVFVYPSAIESFGHPLVEALASGLPVVAADAPVNRELAGDAALYFNAYDPLDCARQIRRLLHDDLLRRQLCVTSVTRSRHFRWSTHAATLLKAFAGTPDSRPHNLQVATGAPRGHLTEMEN